MRIKPAGSDWIDTNNELIVNLIKLQDLNGKSEKRVSEALAKIDLEKLNQIMLKANAENLKKWEKVVKCS